MQSTVDKMSEFIIRAPRRYGLRNRRDVASSFLHRSFLDCTHTVPSDSDLESESSENCLTRVSRGQLGLFQWWSIRLLSTSSVPDQCSLLLLLVKSDPRLLLIVRAGELTLISQTSDFWLWSLVISRRVKNIKSKILRVRYDCWNLELASVAAWLAGSWGFHRRSRVSSLSLSAE